MGRLGEFYKDHKNNRDKAERFFKQAMQILAELVHHFPAYAEFQHNLKAIKNILAEF